MSTQTSRQQTPTREITVTLVIRVLDHPHDAEATAQRVESIALTALHRAGFDPVSGGCGFTLPT